MARIISLDPRFLDTFTSNCFNQGLTMKQAAEMHHLVVVEEMTEKFPDFAEGFNEELEKYAAADAALLKQQLASEENQRQMLALKAEYEKEMKRKALFQLAGAGIGIPLGGALMGAGAYGGYRAMKGILPEDK